VSDLAHELQFDDDRAGAQIASNDTVMLRPLEPADRDRGDLIFRNTFSLVV
jgi:hypothetical protein